MQADYLVVALNGFEVRNPRRERERCEQIYEKHRGMAAIYHTNSCHHCQALVDACHDAALLFEVLLKLDPDATAPTNETLTSGFEVIEA